MHGLDVLYCLLYRCTQGFGRGICIWSGWRGGIAIIVRPPTQGFEFAQACPCELHAAAGDVRAVGVAVDGAMDAGHDVGVAAAGDAECSDHLSEVLVRRAVVDNRALLACVCRRCDSAGFGHPCQPLEDRLAVCVLGAPSWAFLAFQADEIEAGAGVFDAVVPGGAVALLDLAGEVFLGEPFEGGFQGGPAGVRVEEGGVDDEGVGDFEGGEVGVKGVPD